MVVFVTQVARRVVRLTLNLERTCATYANGKRRKRSKDTARLSHMKPDCQTSERWLEDFGTLDRKSQLLTCLDIWA
jgi:hypothetical protein